MLLLSVIAHPCRKDSLITPGQLWRNMDLPADFRRDVWRVIPGTSNNNNPADYALDKLGRVWMTCGVVAARWNNRHWICVVNRVPVSYPTFSAQLHLNNGVVMVMDHKWVVYFE